MPPLTTRQRADLAQFQSITGIPEKAAQKAMKAAGWKVDLAIASFYETSGSGGAPLSKTQDLLGKLFEKYRDGKVDEKDMVSVDGTMQYLNDLGLNMESCEMLLPMEIVQAPSFGAMTKEGFVNGWKALGADTLAKQKTYLNGQIKQLRTDQALFKRVYKHTFIFAKEKGTRALDKEAAIVYWSMLFSAPGTPWVTGTTNWIDLWTEYLNVKWSKSINKDMWNQTFEFYSKTMQDEAMSFWSEESAWPGVIDEFVAFVKEKRSGDTMETD